MATITREELRTSGFTAAGMTSAETFNPWPLSWSAVWVAALASLAAALVLGLIGTAPGAYLIGPEHRLVDLKKVTLVTLAYSVCSSFFACVVGGWVAAKVAGSRRSETAMLHGAISWLVSIPILVCLISVGAGSYFDGRRPLFFAGSIGRDQRRAVPS